MVDLLNKHPKIKFSTKRCSYRSREIWLDSNICLQILVSSSKIRIHNIFNKMWCSRCSNWTTQIKIFKVLEAALKVDSIIWIKLMLVQAINNKRPLKIYYNQPINSIRLNQISLKVWTSNRPTSYLTWEESNRLLIL